MRRTNRQRSALLLGVAVLLGAALWQHRQDQRQAPGTLLAVDPAGIEHVTVQLAGHPAEHYAKRAGHWWHVDGIATRADDGRLADLAAIARAPVLDWRPAAAFQLDKLGLAPPQAVLQLDGQRLAFGTTAVTGPQRYVLVGQRIARVSVRYTPRPARDATQRAP